MFTDGEIKIILKKAKVAWRANKLPVAKEEHFLLMLKTFLSTGGIIKNVCPCCMGSGRKGSNDVRNNKK